MVSDSRKGESAAEDLRRYRIDPALDTAQTVKLANNMSAQILTPLPFSPLR